MKLGHHELKDIHGKGKKEDEQFFGVTWNKERWLSLYRQLITAGFVKVDPQFGGLKLDVSCQEIMKGNIAFRFRQDHVAHGGKRPADGREGSRGGGGVGKTKGVDVTVPEPDKRKRGRPKKPQAPQPKKEETPKVVPVDAEKIFQLLKAKRTEIAKEEGVPAFIIFHNTTLMEMAGSSADSLETLKTIKGVTDKKLELYGEQFLQILKAFRHTE